MYSIVFIVKHINYCNITHYVKLNSPGPEVAAGELRSLGLVVSLFTLDSGTCEVDTGEFSPDFVVSAFAVDSDTGEVEMEELMSFDCDVSMFAVDSVIDEVETRGLVSLDFVVSPFAVGWVTAEVETGEFSLDFVVSAFSVVIAGDVAVESL